MKRRQFMSAAGTAAAAMAFAGVDVFAHAQQEGTPVLTLRNAGCPCCVGWAAHMREHGFEVYLHDSPSLPDVKKRLGIPDDLTSCHTSVVEGYRVEGHVPAEYVRRLLDEKPQVLGIAVAGMPIGSPGMEGPNPASYEVIAFSGSDPAERIVFGTVLPDAVDQ